MWQNKNECTFVGPDLFLVTILLDEIYYSWDYMELLLFFFFVIYPTHKGHFVNAKRY